MTISALDLVPDAAGNGFSWSTIRDTFTWAAALHDCPQDPRWHAEGDVGIHTQMVINALLESEAWGSVQDSERAILFWAAVLHDVAKPAKTYEADTGIHAPGHSRAGAVMARGILYRLNFPFALREQVCALIARHQIPFYLIDKLEENARREAILASLEAPNALLAHLSEADINGRICDDKDEVLASIELFRILCETEGCLDAPYTFPDDHSRYLWCRDADGNPPPTWPLHDQTRSDVIVLSGLPGAGKSTWVAKNVPDLPVVSLDALRSELGIDPAKPQGEVIQAAKERAKQYLRGGHPFIWDATNTTRRIRGQCIDLMHDYKARVNLVYVERPETAMKAANAARQEPVPHGMIDKLIKALETPTVYEASRVTYAVEDTGATHSS